jgi:hypothetical protein
MVPDDNLQHLSDFKSSNICLILTLSVSDSFLCLLLESVVVVVPNCGERQNKKVLNQMSSEKWLYSKPGVHVPGKLS